MLLIERLNFLMAYAERVFSNDPVFYESHSFSKPNIVRNIFFRYLQAHVVFGHIPLFSRPDVARSYLTPVWPMKALEIIKYHKILSKKLRAYQVTSSRLQNPYSVLGKLHLFVSIKKRDKALFVNVFSAFRDQGQYFIFSFG